MSCSPRVQAQDESHDLKSYGSSLLTPSVTQDTNVRKTLASQYDARPNVVSLNAPVRRFDRSALCKKACHVPNESTTILCARSRRKALPVIEADVAQSAEAGGADVEKQPGLSTQGVLAKESRGVERRRVAMQGFLPRNMTWRSRHTDDPNCRYVVVGIHRRSDLPAEFLIRVRRPGHLFISIRSATRWLRGPFQAIFSLKVPVGFDIYQCDPAKGVHHLVKLDKGTKVALTDFWRDYSTSWYDRDDHWLQWIHENFNNSSFNTEDGTLALEVRLRWSPTKLVLWGTLPILLSLAIGFWLMYSSPKGEDRLAVIQTAWAIASYIVTTATGKAFRERYADHKTK